MMSKYLIITSCLLFVVSCGVNDSEKVRDISVKDINFNSSYCEVDSDCYVTYYDTNKCCEAGCAVFTFNKEGINRNKVWRESNCDFESEIEFTDEKWYDCYESPFYEFPECSLIPSQIEAICKNNKCVIK